MKSQKHISRTSKRSENSSMKMAEYPSYSEDQSYSGCDWTVQNMETQREEKI